MTTLAHAPAVVPLGRVELDLLPHTEGDVCPVHLVPLNGQVCDRCFLDEDDDFRRSQDQ